MSQSEPEIIVQHRGNLFDLLSEAAEIEHNLMCCYLYAAFSLKRESDGITADQARALAGWRRSIVGVALDEMTHLALVSNLLTAVGAAPHFFRPNFPISPGYHPSGVVVALAPFDGAVLDHFIYLERPEGVDLPDGEGFEHSVAYERGTRSDRLMSSSQDYATVGHLYRGIQKGLVELSSQYGERGLFVGNPERQIGADMMPLPGLCRVTDLASGLAAIETIVRQGEGAPGDSEASHFNRFISVRDEYLALESSDPGFVPARPAARNPVMRRPLDERARVWVNEPETARVLDLANALYNFMLRTLSEAFGSERHTQSERGVLLEASVGVMGALTPICELLTTLPANASYPGVTAGISFAMQRDSLAPWSASGVWRMLSQRCFDLSRGASRLAPMSRALFDGCSEQLEAIAMRFATTGRNSVPLGVSNGAPASAPSPAPAPAPVKPPAPAPAPAVASAPAAAPAAAAPGIEEVPGKHLTLVYEGKRCIHARHCVLGEPRVFLANVQGPWIHPDATDVEALVRAAHDCPSGAIRYRRHDGAADEAAPHVNVLRVRENGPLAIHAEMVLSGAPAGYRATLCRCGASKNKPFCDGSHNTVSFRASGEPATAESQPLAERGGPLRIEPRRNGPLSVTGPLELCSGTGRTILRTTNTLLCRCGGSSNKPYCDGTHLRNGFASD